MKILTDGERYNLSLIFVKLAHRGQVDKVGEKYFGHCVRVANRCKSISAKIVGLFHDTYEDKRITLNELEMLPFLTGHEKYCIKLLNKYHDGSGMSIAHGLEKDYFKRIKSVPIAREVKIADLKDNMDVTRFIRNGVELTDKDRERLRRYEQELAFLELYEGI